MRAASALIGVGTGFLHPYEKSVQAAVIETLRAACGTHARYVAEEGPDGPCDGVAGVMSLVGDVLWALLLGLPRATAIRLARRFAGFDIAFESDDMTDVVGELVNILGGDVAARLDAVGVKVELSLPVVTRGGSMRVQLPGEYATTHMRFASSEGEFCLALGVGQRLEP